MLLPISRIRLMKFTELDSSLGHFGIPTQLDVLTIEAYMISPNDEVARREIRTTTAIEFAGRHLNVLPDDFFRDLFLDSSQAKPLKAVQEASRVPYTRGIIAGMMLHHALGSALEGTEGSALGRAVKELSRRFKGQKYSKDTINAVWGRRKKVSHYWAAFISALLSDPRDRAFPCTVDRVPHFLATADAFRVLGETTRPWKSPTTILPPGESIWLPSSFALPTLAAPPRIFVFSKSD
jgi:hypothetical protein